MSYTDTLTAAGVAAGAALVALWERWADPEDDTVPDETTWLALGTALLVAHRARAVGLADTALAAVLSADAGRAVPTLGLALPEGVERSARAGLVDLLPDVSLPADPEPLVIEDAREAVAVEGKAQTIAQSQDSFHEGMQAQNVPAWQRVTNSGACELCVSLSKIVLPGSAEMYHHRGCACTQRPMLRPTQRRRRRR